MDNQQLQIISDDTILSSEQSEKQIINLKKDEQGSVPMAMNEREGLKGKVAFSSEKSDVRLVVKIAVLKAYISNQKKYTVAEVRFLIDELTSDIIRSYPSIRLEEIRLAIHKGAVGEYGTVYKLDLNAFNGYIRQYINSPKRQEQLALFINGQQSLLLPERTAPSQKEIEDARIPSALKAFDFFKANKFYNDHGGYIFNCLSSLNVLNFTEEQKVVFWKTGKTLAIDRVYSNTSMSKKDKINTVEEIRKKADHTLIYMEARQLALNLFFNDLVGTDTELKDLIDNAEI